MFAPSGTCGYTLDFGQVAVGSANSLDMNLENSGGAPLAVLGVQAPTDPEFTLTLPTQSIQPGSTTAVTMTFKPFAEGMKGGTVTFTTDSTACPTVTVTLSGTGCCSSCRRRRRRWISARWWCTRAPSRW